MLIKHYFMTQNSFVAEATFNLEHLSHPTLVLLFILRKGNVD